MKDKIRHVWRFNHPPEDVWEYLTRSELLEQWLGKMDFKPIVGHKFEVPTKTGTTTKCEVTEVVPFTRLVWSWKYSSAKSKKTFDSNVVFTLVPIPRGTELQLVHDGFTVLEDYINHNNGWTTLGRRLIELVDTNS